MIDNLQIQSLKSGIFIPMKELSGAEILTILTDNNSLQKIYNKAYYPIEKFVVKNSGNSHDAKDLFQESMIILFKKANDSSFRLTSAIETFIYAIAKRKWLYNLKLNNKNVPLLEVFGDAEGNNIEELLIKDEKIKLYLRYFDKLSEGCKAILKLFFNRYSMVEIAEELDFASEGYARKRKHACQNKLIQSIKEDNEFKELAR